MNTAYTNNEINSKKITNPVGDYIVELTPKYHFIFISLVGYTLFLKWKYRLSGKDYIVGTYVKWKRTLNVEMFCLEALYSAIKKNDILEYKWPMIGQF